MHSETSNNQGNEPEELDAAGLDEVSGGAKMLRMESMAKTAKYAELSKSSASEFGVKKEADKIVLSEELETI